MAKNDAGTSQWNDGRKAEREPTPICAIGASAGGVQALCSFFRHVPVDLGLAYVVIIHLSPDQPSAMREILAGVTRMQVHQVTDTPRLEPNCVYVIPPDRELVIEGDDIHARPFTEPRGSRAPIDMFFRSIAVARGDGLAVVLSGAGSDGAIGVRAVKAAGGVVFVQEPAEAEYPMMPRSAIATGAADFVARLEKLVERVVEVTQSKAAVHAIRADENNKDLRQILSFVRARTGHDFSSYKRATVMRRIGRRMQVTRRASLRDYSDYLTANPEEGKELFEDLLISVTSFFRDPAAYAVLAAEAIAPIFDEAGEAGIRAWVVGCATGEEAYSLAILFLEEAQRRHVAMPIQIFATDLDEGALATAREGRFPASIEADVSEERLKRFFVREGTHYTIKREVRDIVLFAAHSVLREPPFLRLDLVSCRNLLIYLERELQRQVCTLFHYGLRPHGFLFLGSAESVDAAPGSFIPVHRDARIYRARPAARRSMAILSNLPAEQRPHLPDERDSRGKSERRRLREQDRGIGAAHAAALERAAPPSALVGHENTILHLSPSAGRFLLAGAGPFTADIVTLVRPELRLEMAGALRRALEHGEATLAPPVSVGFNGSARRIVLHVMPVSEDDVAPVSRAVVFFLDGGAVDTSAAESSADANEDEVRRLRDELRLAEDRLKLSRIEHEDAIQDLRIANEELQSINEEYRSTSEELETSKEELQSMNEELETVNTELKAKLESISTAHSDLQNLVTSTEIGTLFLDPHLRIRMFTPAVTDVFSITDSDVGRRITDFTHRLTYDRLEGDAAEVLRQLAPREQEVETRDGRCLIMRLRPYRTVDDHIDGLVLTFIDVTARKTAESALAAELRAMNRLQQLATRVVEAEELDPPLREVLDAAIELLGAQAGCIQLLDEKTRRVRIAVQRGLPQRFIDRFGDVAEDERTPYERLTDSEYVLVEDFEMEPGNTLFIDETRAAGIRAQASMPLLNISGRRVGTLNTNFRDPRKFSEHQLRLLAICARQAADAINAHQLQEKLRASEARLRRVLETETIGVQFFDNAGVLVDANDAFLHLTGYTRQRVQELRMTWRTMTPPEYLEESEQQMAAMARSGRSGPYEKEYVCADGSRRWMISVGRRIESDLIAEYAIDISERKAAEAALRASEDRLRRVLETEAVGVLFFDKEGTLVEANDAFLQLTGYDRSDVTSGALTWQIMTPAEWLATSEAQMAAFATTGRIGPYEKQYLRKDGGRRWMLFAGRDLGDGAIVEYCIDITDRKHAEAALAESEARLHSILATVPEAMIVIDEQGTIESFSATAERLFGWSAKEAIGRNVSMLMPNPDTDGHNDGNAAKGEWLVIGIARIRTGRRRDGSTFPMELSVGEVQLGDRRLFTGFVRDLTDRRQTQARLQELQAELLHVARLSEAGAMASALAHEMNQPLGAVVNAARAAGRMVATLPEQPGGAVASAREAIELVAEQALRAGEILRRLREFVARGGESDRRLENLPKLIEEASALALVGSKELGVRVSYDFAPQLPLVLADRLQIQQVLFNLIRNAVQAMTEQAAEDEPEAPHARRALTVSAAAVGDEAVEIAVVDTGPGIPPEIAERLFQPFVSNRPGGMGIGLSICRTIVEAHGGQLRAEPNPGGGTVFRFVLPVATAADMAVQ